MALRLRCHRNVAVVLITFGLIVVGLAFLLALAESTRFDMGMRVPRSPVVIRSVDWDGSAGKIRFLVENTGDKEITLREVYVNGTLDSGAAVVPQVLLPNQAVEIILSKTYVDQPTVVDVRVATSDRGLSAYFQKRFFEITLEQVNWNGSTGQIRVLVKNVGDKTVTLSGVNVNGTSDAAAITSPIVLSNQTAVVNLSGKFVDTHTYIPIKVTTIEGASAERSSPIFGVWIGSIGWDDKTDQVWALVNSNGYEAVTFGGVYVNGTLDASATITGSPSVYTVTLSKMYLDGPLQLTLKVVTTDGAFYEMAYPNFRIRIEDVTWDNSTGQIKVRVQDMSANGVTFNHVYVNGTLDDAATVFRAPPVARMYEVTLSGKYLIRSSQITVKITTVEGSFTEKQKTFGD